MSALAIHDPAGYLNAAGTSDAFGDVIENAKGNCGPILQGIDWAMNKILHWSPIEAIMSPLAGDFNGVDQMRSNWDSTSKGLNEVAENYRRMANHVDQAWRAGSATLARAQLLDLASAHGRQSTATGLMSRQLGNMMSATSQVVQAVAGILGLIEEWVLTLSVAKLAKELITMGGGIRRAITLINQAIDLIQSLSKLIPALIEACGIFALVMQGVNVVLSGAAAASHGQAGSHVDETANSGFPGTGPGDL
ncbi:hypothetical protein GCM10009867_33520 [Pedococcus aerophilus]|uniref:Uncharacterized protein n=1 Tax=Pedococcus aerophilus TaxID=436356 RepID=A0ABN3UWE7_9MICO